MVFGKDSQKAIPVQLGTNDIKQSQMEPYLGTVLTPMSRKVHDYINKRIESCQSVCYASQSLGSKTVPVTPVILSKLYYATCIPKLCYAIEIMDVKDNMLQGMEKFHTKNAKMFQGLMENSCNVGSLKMMG